MPSAPSQSRAAQAPASSAAAGGQPGGVQRLELVDDAPVSDDAAGVRPGVDR